MTAEEREPPDRVTVGYSRPPDTKNMEGLPPESESNSYRSQGPEQKSTNHTERKITKMTIFFFFRTNSSHQVGGRSPKGESPRWGFVSDFSYVPRALSPLDFLSFSLIRLDWSVLSWIGYPATP